MSKTFDHSVIIKIVHVVKFYVFGTFDHVVKFHVLKTVLSLYQISRVKNSHRDQERTATEIPDVEKVA